MGVTCILCKAKHVAVSKGIKGRSFHWLPVNDAELREKWIDFIKSNTGTVNWQPKPLHRICSDHFNIDDYEDFNACHRKLKPGACPRYFHPSEAIARSSASYQPPGGQNNGGDDDKSGAASNVDSPPRTKRRLMNPPEGGNSSSRPTASTSSQTEELNPEPAIPKHSEVTVLYVYERHKIRLAELEAAPQPLRQTEMQELNRMKSNLAKLEAKLIKHGAQSVRERLVVPEEISSQVTEFVQVEYLLLKVEQKFYETALEKKDKVIEDLEEQKEMLKGIVGDLRDELGNSCSKMDELVKERSELLDRTMNFDACHAKLKLDVQKQKEELLKLRTENARLRGYLII